MENIANKTGFAGLVKKIAGVVGVVVVAGGVAGCVTDKFQPSAGFVNVNDKTKKKFPYCASLNKVQFDPYNDNKIYFIIDKNHDCFSKIKGGGTTIEYKVTRQPKNGRIDFDGRKYTITPNKDFVGIDSGEIYLDYNNGYNRNEKAYVEIIYLVKDGWRRGDEIPEFWK